ncbi:Alpha-tubulin N-acetyltransferase [Tetrabaena socialis]|uniref:Alpha-tubulin N-acetyltransferase n=1 Tax=Tetrabaena socialis TaxID=47790 RepID=A0A2J7ZXG4_9CHLO|nr:Alpha-tubulin N-acetyltransferase [Tetrabaena socialis]|eukprot:PNH04963.1 Alpha-tubulin N-acetyltransferase [Tetrabaena socialis]
MEFDFVSLAFASPGDSDRRSRSHSALSLSQGDQHIQKWDETRIRALKAADEELLTKLLDVFGKMSAVAQGLHAPVTDIYRLRSTDQRLYLYMYRQSTKTVVLGGLKVGTKRLYVRTGTADLREIEPVCVLDFYVHESVQRQGMGKALFEHFLTTEGLDPANLGYDRPSPKLLGFLKKHYGLNEYLSQSNNYVVFNRYFELNPQAGGSRQSAQNGGSYAS